MDNPQVRNDASNGATETLANAVDFAAEVALEVAAEPALEAAGGFFEGVVAVVGGFFASLF